MPANESDLKVKRCIWLLCDQIYRHMALTVVGSIPHPLGDDLSRGTTARRRHGLVQGVSVEHQAVVETSRNNIHLGDRKQETGNRSQSLTPQTETAGFYCFVFISSFHVYFHNKSLMVKRIVIAVISRVPIDFCF